VRQATWGPELEAAARAVLPEVVAVRRAIHAHPEIGLALPATQATILEALAPFDLDVRTGSAVTSVVADLRGGAGDGPTVVLRADMDALPMPEDTGVEFASKQPGVMHACGHDAHVAMLLGAVRLLHDRRAGFTGTVRFMFQPGEEGFHGARHMIDEGVLADPEPDAAFAIHVTPNVPSGYVAARAGTILAAADEIYATISGRGGHASQPHLSNDPIPVLCEAVLALQTFVTRRVDVFNPAVVTIGSLHAGTTDNVIPETGRLEGTIRTTSEATRSIVHAGIERVLHGIAAAHGMRSEVEIVHGYPVTVNEAAFVERVAGVTKGLFGDQRYFTMPAPAMGAEDFSYVLQKVPGAMVFLGACPPGVGLAEAASCHSNRMLIDEDALAAGVALHAAVALDVLARPPRR
jgi:amidohydrolase